jgi:hypothetical protein
MCRAPIQSHFLGTGARLVEHFPPIRIHGMPRNVAVPYVARKVPPQSPVTATTLSTFQTWKLDMRGIRPSRHTLARRKRVSPSFHSLACRSKARGVEATVRLATQTPAGTLPPLRERVGQPLPAQQPGRTGSRRLRQPGPGRPARPVLPPGRSVGDPADQQRRRLGQRP